MRKTFDLALLTAAGAFWAFAGTVEAPEINASAGAAALALLTGSLVVLRSRRKR